MSTPSLQRPSPNITVTHQETSFTGPIPPPEILARYSEVVPNGADRILRMAENQSNHRQEMESRYLRHEIVRSYMGVICGFFIGMTGILSSAYLVSQGHNIAGTILGGGSLGGLVTAFLKGYGSRREERERRDKQNRALMQRGQG